MTRKALLLGVVDYFDDRLAKLGEVPKNDVNQLFGALAMAGYDENHILKDAGSHGGGVIKKRIRTMLNEATPQDELFIYFSGHGCENNDNRYLLPYDFDPIEEVDFSQLVSEEYIYRLACKSAAKSVVFFMDACRDGVTLVFTDEGGAKSLGSSVQSVSQDPRPTIAFVYACTANSQSYYGPVEDGFTRSFFANALARVLQRGGENVPAKLSAVLEATQAELYGIAAAAQCEQVITLSPFYQIGLGGEPADLLLREDAGAAFHTRVKQSKWCKQVKTLDLWQGTFENDDQSPVVLQIMAIVLAAEAQVKAAKVQAPEQDWRPDNAPFNVLNKLDLIYRETAVDDQQWLSLGEVALALCTPCV
ncbi:MAG: caspase family protein, partial [Psychrosphaera sp.]|nr:caspase family protein [Psychrosphaera sp.]